MVLSDNPPKWLKNKAKQFWRTFAATLDQEGILTLANVDLVASMCESYSVYLDAVELLRKQGRVITTHTGATKINPLVSVEKQSWEMFVRGYRELGLTDKIKGQTTSELDEFLET